MSAKTSEQGEHCCQSLQPVPPLLSCLPVCLHPSCAKPAHPHHGHASAPPPEREEDWTPAMRAGSKIFYFLGRRLWPMWMSLAQAPQTEESLAWKELHHFATTSVALLTVSTVIPAGTAMPHTSPKSGGHLEQDRYQRQLRFPNKQQEGPSELGRGEIALVCIMPLHAEELENICCILPPLE